MAVVHLPAVRPALRPASIEIAGSAWPLYKLEALAAALATCLIFAVITGSLQAAVLTGAVIGVVR